MTDYVAQKQLANELKKHGIEEGRLPPACLLEFVVKARSVAEMNRGSPGSEAETLGDHLYGMAVLIAQTLKGEVRGENFAREILSRHGIDVPANTGPAGPTEA